MTTKAEAEDLNGFKFDPNVKYSSKPDPYSKMVLPRAVATNASDDVPTRDNNGPHITQELPRRLNLNAQGKKQESAKTRLEQMLEANLLADLSLFEKR